MHFAKLSSISSSRSSSSRGLFGFAPILLTAKKDNEKETLETFFDSTQSASTVQKKLMRLPLIGSGSAASVYRFYDPSRQKFFAIKQFTDSYYRYYSLVTEGPALNEDLIRECSILLFSNHPNIVSLYKVYVIDRNVYEVFEFSNIDVRHLIDDHFPTGIPHGILKSITWDLFQGLHYLHTKGVIHRDLRVSNLLLNYPSPPPPPSHVSSTLHTGVQKVNDDEKYRHALLHPDYKNTVPSLKICDFDWSRIDVRPGNATKYISGYATTRNRSPEGLFELHHYGTQADMWSAGIILLHMFWGQPLGVTLDDKQWIQFLVRSLGQFNAQEEGFFRQESGGDASMKHSGMMNAFDAKMQDMHIYSIIPDKEPLGLGYRRRLSTEDDRLFVDMILKLLKWMPQSRSSARQILKHSYFDSIRESDLTRINNGRIVAQPIDLYSFFPLTDIKSITATLLDVASRADRWMDNIVQAYGAVSIARTNVGKQIFFRAVQYLSENKRDVMQLTVFQSMQNLFQIDSKSNDVTSGSSSSSSTTSTSTPHSIDTLCVFSIPIFACASLVLASKLLDDVNVTKRKMFNNLAATNEKAIVAAEFVAVKMMKAYPVNHPEQFKLLNDISYLFKAQENILFITQNRLFQFYNTEPVASSSTSLKS